MTDETMTVMTVYLNLCVWCPIRAVQCRTLLSWRSPTDPELCWARPLAAQEAMPGPVFATATARPPSATTACPQHAAANWGILISRPTITSRPGTPACCHPAICRGASAHMGKSVGNIEGLISEKCENTQFPYILCEIMAKIRHALLKLTKILSKIVQDTYVYDF